MKVAVFSAKSYDRTSLTTANADHQHELIFFEPRLEPATVNLARDFPAVCVFVQDQVDAPVVRQLSQFGTQVIALRCAGFNNVDLDATRDGGITVVRVPAYSPYAVAEHTIGLMLSLNRGIHRAYSRVRDGNFALEGLLGFDLHGRTVGIVGTGQIGAVVAQIANGFGCRILAHDVVRNPSCEAIGVNYVGLDLLLSESDIITLHCPLTPETDHLIDSAAVKQMKPGVMLINTSRGQLIDTHAVVHGLKSGAIGYLGLDVYEEEADVFFEDLSNRVIQDDVLARLLTFPNVVITGHQAFFTADALTNIAETTLANLSDFDRRRQCANEIAVHKTG